jgi:predicted phosphate transport protein (TIGR00153 family)
VGAGPSEGEEGHVRLPLVPRERRFFDLFEQHAACTVAAAEILIEVLTEGSSAAAHQTEIKEWEHRGDGVTHEIVRTLNRTFVTPFDREDIYALSSGLDDVLDFVDEVATTIVLYRITVVPEPGLRMGHLLLEAAREVQQAIGKLERLADLEPHWIEIHRIENVGDNVSKRAIAQLFDGSFEPLEVVKLKDLYGLLESGLDRCEDVANVIESITIKNA